MPSRGIDVDAMRLGLTYIFYFGAGKSSEGIGTIGCGDETGLSEIVFCLQVADLGLIWPIDNADGNGEDSVALFEN